MIQLGGIEYNSLSQELALLGPSHGATQSPSFGDNHVSLARLERFTHMFSLVGFNTALKGSSIEVEILLRSTRLAAFRAPVCQYPDGVAASPEPPPPFSCTVKPFKTYLRRFPANPELFRVHEGGCVRLQEDVRWADSKLVQPNGGSNGNFQHHATVHSPRRKYDTKDLLLSSWGCVAFRQFSTLLRPSSLSAQTINTDTWVTPQPMWDAENTKVDWDQDF